MAGTLPRTVLGDKFLLRTGDLNDFCGRDGLAGVALGMVGDVNEKATEGSGNPVAADVAGRFKGLREGEDAGTAGSHGVVEFGEDFGVGSLQVRFGAQGGELVRAERLPFRVGKQAVERAGDVTDLEGYGRQVVWSAMELFLA